MINELINKLFINSLVYDDSKNNDMLKGHFDSMILSDEVISLIKKYSDECIINKSLDIHEKDRLYNILSYIRNNVKEKSNIISDIIVNLNSNLELNQKEFLFNEYAARLIIVEIAKIAVIFPQFISNIFITLKLIFKKQYDYTMLLKNSLSKDFQFVTLLTVSDNQDFIDSIPLIAKDVYFYMTINKCIMDYDFLFDDATFNERLKKVIDYAKDKEGYTKITSESKILTKFVDKSIKFHDEE